MYLGIYVFRVFLLMNTNKEHLIKVFLVSSEVGPVRLAVYRSVGLQYFFLIFNNRYFGGQKYTVSDQSTGTSRNFSPYFVQSGYVQNKLEYSKEAMISLKLWVPKTSF